MSHGMPRSTLLPWLVLAALAPAALHCGQASESASFSAPERVGTPADSSGPDGASSVTLPGPPTSGGSQDVDAGPRPPPPPPVGVLLVHAHATLPAFRVCPAAPGATPAAPLSADPSAPIPSTLMPRSNLAGVDVQSAVFMAKDPGYDSVRKIVLVLLNEATKGNEGLVSGACSSVACGGTGCVGSANLRLVDLPDEGLFGKDGTILTLTGASDTDLRFTTGKMVASDGGGPGRLSAQLVNESTFRGGVTLRSQGTAVPVDPGAARSLTYADFGAEVVAGTHRQSLLDLYEGAAPSKPPAAFYAPPLALVLVGAAAGPRPLKFLAVPLTL